MRPDRSSRYRLAEDLDSWRTDVRVDRRGFAHRWDSVVADGNGEDMFMRLLDEHLGPDLDVLDVGCGHGELTVRLAPRVRSIVGIDRDRDLLDLAEELAADTTSARFVHAHLAGPDEGSSRGVPLPLPDRSIDVVIDRRGPIPARFVDDLLRVARPGATVIGLHPTGSAPPPAWVGLTPSLAGRFVALPFDQVVSWVTGPLNRLGIDDYDYWWIDVTEHLPSPRALHGRIAADVEWEAVRSDCERAFEAAATHGELVLRHQRLLWRCRLP